MQIMWDNKMYQKMEVVEKKEWRMWKLKEKKIKRKM